MPAKTVPCPNCKNGIVKLSTVTGRFDRAISCLNRGEVARAALGFLKALGGLVGTAENSLVMCDTCNNKRTIPNTTDNSKQYQEVAKKLEANIEKISELESKLGKGGDEFKITTGDVVVHCGLIMNDTPSYRIDPQASPTRGYVADGSGVQSGKGTMWTGGGKTNAVVGLNPLPTPGGEYTLVCTNKYRLVVGNRGIEVKTGGPVTIDGGITRITGPQVTIGTSTGRLVLEGDVVNINGTSIELTPNGKGQVVVAGTLGVTGNSIVGGHLHAENISFVGATCTAKNETTTTSAPTDIISGPASWSGLPNLTSKKNGLVNALNDLIGHSITTTSDLRKIAGLLFNRGQNQLLDKMKNVIYNTYPMELMEGVPVSPTLPLPLVPISKKTAILIRQSLLPSGYCLYYLGSPTSKPYRLGIMYSFPHVHALHDGEHSHTHRGPNIQLEDAPEGVRKNSAGAASNATKSASFESLIEKAVSSISKSFPQAYAFFSKMNPFK
jgi:hypothetical protein